MGNCCSGSYNHDERNSTAHLADHRVGGNVMKPSVAAMQDPSLKRPMSPVVAGAGRGTGGVGNAMKASSNPATPVHGLAAPNVGGAPVGSIVTPNLKVFTLAELRSATRNFRPDTLLGEGGFGMVFKGWIDPNTLAPSKGGVGIPVAIKKCSPDSGQGRKEWETEVNFLGKLSHPNLVKLIGYCTEEKELLLVYEYMHKGSLEGQLFNSKRNVEPPSWGLRMKIATDAARGLDFLHTSKKTVIYRDFKTSNILLDEGYNAKLSDFGLARLGPAHGNTHVSTQAVGTYGYAAPEYISTGHLYVKSDVYGFGVVLLELLTGLKAYDLERPASQIDLVQLHRPFLRDRSKLKKIIDPRLMDRYPPEGAQKLAQLILRCLENDPRDRPSMSQVLVILEQISTIVMKPKKTRSEPPQRNFLDHDPMDRYPASNIGRPGHTGPLRSPRDMP